MKSEGGGPFDERFEAIYRKHYGRVWHYFRANRIADDEAHDLSQDTFKRLYERMDTLRNENAWPFVAKIARTILLNRVRARQTQKRRGVMIDIDDPQAPFREPAAPPEPDCADRETEELLWTRLHAAFASLPTGQSLCLRLWMEGFQYEEIMKILGISMDAVKSRLRDAKRTLREQLGETQ